LGVLAVRHDALHWPVTGAVADVSPRRARRQLSL